MFRKHVSRFGMYRLMSKNVRCVLVEENGGIGLVSFTITLIIIRNLIVIDF